MRVVVCRRSERIEKRKKKKKTRNEPGQVEGFVNRESEISRARSASYNTHRVCGMTEWYRSRTDPRHGDETEKKEEEIQEYHHGG